MTPIPMSLHVSLMTDNVAARTYIISGPCKNEALVRTIANMYAPSLARAAPERALLDLQSV